MEPNTGVGAGVDELAAPPKGDSAGAGVVLAIVLHDPTEKFDGAVVPCKPPPNEGPPGPMLDPVGVVPEEGWPGRDVSQAAHLMFAASF